MSQNCYGESFEEILAKRLEKAEKQRDELLTAIREVFDDAEECQDYGGWTAMMISLDAFHNLDTTYESVIDSVKGGA